MILVRRQVIGWMFFIILLGVVSASALPPLDIKINKAIIKTDRDVYDYSIKSDFTIGYGFELETAPYLMIEIHFVDDYTPGPADISIYFCPNKDLALGYDPVNNTVPKDLITYGRYNINSSKKMPPGIITWGVKVEARQHNLHNDEITIVDQMSDNNTDITIKGVEYTYMIDDSDNKKERESIQNYLSDFNESLRHIELHYLA